MRKVKFKKYKTSVYQPPLGIELLPGQRRELIEKAKWDEDFIHDGLFHQWGSAFEDMGENGAGNYTVALVEDANGIIHEVLPSNIKFVD